MYKTVSYRKVKTCNLLRLYFTSSFPEEKKISSDFYRYNFNQFPLWDLLFLKISSCPRRVTIINPWCLCTGINARLKEKDHSITQILSDGLPV